MNEDTAGQVHFKLYGLSDKLNAKCNKNEEFRAGYWQGVYTVGYDAKAVIADEYALRKETKDALDSNFEEWKRGFWAARSQLIAAGIRRKRKKC